MEGSLQFFGGPVAFSTDGEFPGPDDIRSNSAEKPTEANNELLKQDYCMPFFNFSGCVSRTTEKSHMSVKFLTRFNLCPKSAKAHDSITSLTQRTQRASKQALPV